ncbi:MAG: ASCH domain-containing protein [Bacteroidetes bacterium]|nr:ASCH domain-containing protein [Bacteroidota bacterium]
MQYKREQFSPEIHEMFKALSVKQPHADNIANGRKRIELRNQNTKHRGDVLICSSASPVIDGLMSGCSLCFVELYEVKKVSELTEDEKKSTFVSTELMNEYEFAWLLRDPRRVIEFPVKGQLGIYNLVYTKNCIMQYPDVSSWFDEKPEELIFISRKNIRNVLIVLWLIALIVLFFIVRKYELTHLLY